MALGLALVLLIILALGKRSACPLRCVYSTDECLHVCGMSTQSSSNRVVYVWTWNYLCTKPLMHHRSCTLVHPLVLLLVLADSLLVAQDLPTWLRAMGEGD